MESALHFTRTGRLKTGNPRWWPPRVPNLEINLCLDHTAHLASHVTRGKRARWESVNSSVQTNASVLGKSTYVHSFNKYWPSASRVLVTDCPRYHGPSSEWARHCPALTKLPRYVYTHRNKDFLFMALGVYPPIKRLKDIIWKDPLTTNKEVKCTRHLINTVWARQVKHTLVLSE